MLSGLTIANGLTPGNELGGGILNSGNLTTVRSAISGNSGYTGGGIRNTGELTVSSSTVSENTARYPDGGGQGGAGISNFQGTVAVVNSTVSGNTTAGRGGGIINAVGVAPNSSIVTIANSTIAANAGDAGANLFNSTNGGTAVLSYRSTIISDPQGGESNCGSAGGGSSGLTSQGYNLADDDGCNLTTAVDQPNTEPNLGPLADNGGPTRTMALPPGSPAVDKATSVGLTADQRGFARPVVFPAIPNAPGGDGADIGAFELQPPPPSPPPPSPDTEVEGSATAKKTQKQKGKKIIVKAKVKAKEDLEAKATGKVKVGKKSYKLQPQSKSVNSDQSKNLKLKPKKSKDAKKIAKALKRGKKAKAKVTVKLTDEAGNARSEKLSVTLKR